MGIFRCTTCNGVGQVSGGYFSRAGDYDTWVSGNATEKCQTCDGKGYIVLDNNANNVQQ